MQTVADLAEWIRNESKVVERLSGYLCQSIACIPKDNLTDWLSELGGHFERFRAHFQKHMALEEGAGYMAPVLERRPGLGEEVEQLRAQHREISHLMTDIYEQLRRLTPDTPLMALDCCRRIQNLIDCIARHEERENLLVSHVFAQDLGTSD